MYEAISRIGQPHQLEMRKTSATDLFGNFYFPGLSERSKDKKIKILWCHSKSRDIFLSTLEEVNIAVS